MNKRFQNIGLAVSILCLCMISSCKVGESYERKTEILPQTFKTEFQQDSSLTNLSWWSLFKDSILVSLIDTALVNNQNIQIAVSRLNEASYYREIAAADLIPQINYGAAASTTKTSNNSKLVNSIVPAVSVSYTVDLWQRISTLNDVATQNYFATIESYGALQIGLVSAVATAYISLRDIDNRLLIAEKTAKNFQDNLDVMQARYNAGIINDVDLSQAKIQLSEAKTAIQVFLRLRGQTENAINILLGRAPQEIPRGLSIYEQLAVPNIPVGVPSQLLDRRPDVLQTERLLHAQTLNVGATEALKYPTLTLSADLGAQLINPGFIFAELGAQLFGPLFNANRINNTVSAEKEKMHQAYLAYQATFLNAVKEVEDAMISSNTYNEEYKYREEQRLLAENASHLSWVRYDGGLTSYLEVLNLQSSLFNAELNASIAYTQSILSIVNLYEALGGGWVIE